MFFRQFPLVPFSLLCVGVCTCRCSTPPKRGWNERRTEHLSL